MTAFPAYEGSQSLPLSILPKHHLRVDAEGDLWVGMANLPYDICGVVARSKQQGDEGTA